MILLSPNFIYPCPRLSFPKLIILWEEELVNHPLQNLDYIVFDCEIASNIFKVRPAGLTNGPKTEADIKVVI